MIPLSIVRRVEEVRKIQYTGGVARDTAPGLPILTHSVTRSPATTHPTTLWGWLYHSSLPEELGQHSLTLLPISFPLPSKDVLQLDQEGGGRRSRS